MKSFYNKLNVIITVFFVLGILFSAFNLYNLPTEMEQVSGKIDLTAIKEVLPVIKQTNFIVGITFVLGLGSVILSLYLLNFTKVSEKIVYVEKTETQKKTAEEKEVKRQKDSLEKRVNDILKTAKNINDKKARTEKLLNAVCNTIEASQAIVYEVKKEKDKQFIELFATYAYSLPDSKTIKYEFGEGLAGQVAKEQKKINIDDVPEGYINIISGLGSSSPNHLLIQPVKDNKQLIFVLEVASFKEIHEEDERLVSAVFQKEIDRKGQPSKKSVAKKDTDTKSEKKK